mmetsp:Transcript_24847/g.42221  ORF Transcript_24847/g.42221 Transcript_24847/m.42221 type:complete len:82 (-) Transcript_24847:131-376(-)
MHLEYYWIVFYAAKPNKTPATFQAVTTERSTDKLRSGKMIVILCLVLASHHTFEEEELSLSKMLQLEKETAETVSLKRKLI